MLKRNNIVITWPSHHASVSTGVMTEANKNQPKYKNDCMQHNNIEFLHVSIIYYVFIWEDMAGRAGMNLLHFCKAKYRNSFLSNPGHF